ncbi:hypothetical protein BAE44_0014162 [Dichanthelium oligosanthes]|uniref:Uncharacterized protein n=1 Tax=Dichanthelium oligosanthes TaxID=888268 RepID=A0A1E5VI59_9POAL|nr:hypothetical protein BAE44_0014162 [Dichanthelium oligosanthes]
MWLGSGGAQESTHDLVVEGAGEATLSSMATMRRTTRKDQQEEAVAMRKASRARQLGRGRDGVTVRGRELGNEKLHKDYPSAASEKGATASGDMVKTNDYGRYDPTPAFSKPRFKIIPN